MPRLRTALAILALPLLLAAAPDRPPLPGYELYVNARYGFSAEVPAGLARERAPDNGDGQSFRARDGGLRLTVSAIPDAEGGGLEEALSRTARRCGTSPPEYLVRRGDWFALSCATGSGILYARTFLSGQGDEAVLTDLVARYPAAERARWDPVVAHVSRSLRPAPPLCEPNEEGGGRQC